MTAFITWKAEVGISSQMRSAPDECQACPDGLLKRFARDQSGSYAIIIALLMPVLVGTAGLGTEVAWWFYKHKNMMSAADSAAVSAATAGTNFATEANAITTVYGYANGIGNVTVTVNQPPSTGSFTSSSQAVEVIITQPQARLMSALFGSGAVPVTARAVALGNVGTGCVLALDPTANPAVTVKGSTQLNLINCNLYDNSNGGSALNVSGSATISAAMVGIVGGVSGASSITATNGIRTGIRAIADPYANVVMPTPGSCDYNNKTYKNTVTIDPGVYCNGIQLNAGAIVTMNPGVYFIDRGSLQMAGGATLQGTGVTIILTSSTGSNYADATINGGATLAITAPTTGPLAGIAIFGDRNMPTSTTFKFNGGDNQVIGGAVYVPHGTLQYAGGNNTSTNCTQVIADNVTFVGNSLLKINCSGYGTRPIGSSVASLVE